MTARRDMSRSFSCRRIARCYSSCANFGEQFNRTFDLGDGPILIFFKHRRGVIIVYGITHDDAWIVTFESFGFFDNFCAQRSQHHAQIRLHAHFLKAKDGQEGMRVGKCIHQISGPFEVLDRSVDAPSLFAVGKIKDRDEAVFAQGQIIQRESFAISRCTTAFKPLACFV